VVSQLEQRLSYSSAPLSDTQSQQLVQILAATSPTHDNGGRNGALGSAMVALSPGGGTFFGGPAITADTITQAQGVLSSQQMSALQGLQQEQQAAAQLRQQMKANLQNQAPSTPTAVVNQTPVPKTGPSKTE